MASFSVLQSNFTVSTMVEHGTLAFFLDGVKLFGAENFTANNKIVLSPGPHSYQWQVNGQRGVTRYSIRLMLNGKSIPATAIGPRILPNDSDIDFSAGNFTV
jgi:hypothetical protein